MDSKEKKERINTFIQESMKDTNGKLFIGLLIERTGLLQPTSSLEVGVQSYENGKRAVGFCIKDMLDSVDKSYFSTIIKGEHNE